MTQSLVLDANVAVKWYIPEEGSAAARALLDTPAIFIAPALLLAEVTNVLWKKVRRGEIERDDARTIAAHLCTESLIDYRAVQPLTEAALDIALQFGQTVYDALYLALAAAEDTQMVTADSRLFRSFAATPLEPFVALLGT